MFEMLPIAVIEWQFVLGSTPLEIVATVAAIFGVILIARQNILGWPLGILWAAISAWLCFTQWQLVSDGILYLAYIPIQIYCWVQWRKTDPDSGAPLRPTWMPAKRQVLVATLAGISIILWGFGITAMARNISWIPEPALLWRDSTTTVLNFFAQFLQARKRMENWVVWLVVNSLGVHIYWLKDSPIYSIQYAFFLVLGIYGWVEWQRSREQLQVSE